MSLAFSPLGPDSQANSASGQTAEITLTANAQMGSVSAGMHSLSDYGNLPASFGTLLADDGARHWLTGPYLGAAVFSDGDGTPGSLPSPNDNDGVTRTMGDLWTAGATVHLNVSVGGESGYLAAWFDWDHSGAFESTELVTFGDLSVGEQFLTWC